MLKPDLIEFKDGDLAPAGQVNYNFEQMSDYVFGTADELKALVNSAVANMNLQLQQSVFTGKIEMFAGNADDIPLGWLLCDGSEVSREDYTKLYNVIGTKYGAGNGVTTFNLPNYIGRFLEGGTEAGIVKEAGLPNITGQIANRLRHADDTYANKTIGAFKTESSYGGSWGGGGQGCDTISFNASWSNPIYSDDCETVQPPAVTVLFIIKT